MLWFLNNQSVLLYLTSPADRYIGLFKYLIKVLEIGFLKVGKFQKLKKVFLVASVAA
jgi:hypothetical protein